MASQHAIILVPQLGMEVWPLALEAWNLNWTSREAPSRQSYSVPGVLADDFKPGLFSHPGSLLSRTHFMVSKTLPSLKEIHRGKKL